MKTTLGKSPSAPKPLRSIQIASYERGVIAVVQAQSLKLALIAYFEETLKRRGYTKPLYTGNMLTVNSRQGKTKTYHAYDPAA